MNDMIISDVDACLRNQVVNAESPGTILHDFQVVLDYLGDKGVVAGGKLNLLPMKAIPELDSRLSRPLRLVLKRPQLRSHPYLQGLHLVLRASRLARVEGSGDKARLVLDPFMKAQWEQLNPTEQYFNLLEAMMFQGSPEMVEEKRSYLGGGFLAPCAAAWFKIPEGGEPLRTDDLRFPYYHGVEGDFYLLALMDLFGLVRLEHAGVGTPEWRSTAIQRTPFGDAFFTLLASAAGAGQEGGVSILIALLSFSGWGGRRSPAPLDLPAIARPDEDDEPEERDGFGVWQPLFQPFFPEWRDNLEFPQEEPCEGVFVFHVSLGKIWRRIAMPAESTLDDLMYWILRSVKFDSDHGYEFRFRDRQGRKLSLGSFESLDGYAEDFEIGSSSLEPGQTLRLTYDYGASWNFTVKLERIEPPDAKIKAPAILEKHGKAPEQYGDW